MRSHSDEVRSDVYRIPRLIGESESLYNCKMHDLSSFSRRSHFLNRLLACLASGIAFSLLIQAIAFLSAGRLDPFSPIALVVGCLVGFAVAAPVGLIFHLVHSRAKHP